MSANTKSFQVASFSRKSIDVQERFLCTTVTESYCRINSAVANSSHCRNSSKPLGRHSLAWNESRRLQLRVWKGCRPLSSSLKIPLPWGFPLGAPAGITGAVSARPDSYAEISTSRAVPREYTCITRVLHAHISENRTESVVCNLYPCAGAPTKPSLTIYRTFHVPLAWSR